MPKHLRAKCPRVKSCNAYHKFLLLNGIRWASRILPFDLHVCLSQPQTGRQTGRQNRSREMEWALLYKESLPNHVWNGYILSPRSLTRFTDVLTWNQWFPEHHQPPNVVNANQAHPSTFCRSVQVDILIFLCNLFLYSYLRQGVRQSADCPMTGFLPILQKL